MAMTIDPVIRPFLPNLRPLKALMMEISVWSGKTLLVLFALLTAVSLPKAMAQGPCSAGTNDRNFFTFCQSGSSYSYTGDYVMNIGQGGSITINGNVTINGTLTINFTGNDAFLRISSGFTLLATNVVINNSNPAKVLDIDGAFQVTNNLDFNGENIDMDGTGTLTAGSITDAGNVTCASEGDCPSVSAGSCTGGGLCSEGCPTNCTLPIELENFNASIADGLIALTWATASELNFDYFSVQRSANGIDFKEITQVPGNGTTTERKEYAYEDRFPLLGKSYYRLTSVDFDGYTETFDAVAVNYQGEKSARVFPNPAVDGKLQVELTFTPTEPLSLVVTDLNGVEKSRYQVKEQEASYQLELNEGTYLVKISGGDFSKVMRVVVRQ